VRAVEADQLRFSNSKWRDKRMFTVEVRAREAIVVLSIVMAFAMVFTSTAYTADQKDMEPVNMIYAFDEKGLRIGMSDETVFPFEDCKVVANEFSRMRKDVKSELSRVAKGKKVSFYVMECWKHRSLKIRSDKYLYSTRWKIANGPILN